MISARSDAFVWQLPQSMMVLTSYTPHSAGDSAIAPPAADNSNTHAIPILNMTLLVSGALYRMRSRCRKGGPSAGGERRAGQALFRDHGCKIFDDIGIEYLRRRERSRSLGEIKAD